MTENEVPTSIGELLAQARIDQGLSIAEVAQRINLSQSVIKDIEEERFLNLKARIYFSGYVRSYANVLGLEQSYFAELVSQLDPAIFSRTPRVASVELPVFRARRQFQLNWFRWATVFVVLLLITTTVFWWSSERHHVGAANVANNTIQLQVAAKTNVLAEHGAKAKHSPK
jgi:cytoskeleton protein RodZ